MASGRGSSQDPPLTEIERLRNETIAANQAKLKSLLPNLSDPKPSAKKRVKRTHKTNDGETHDHNLRPRPQTNPAVNVNEQIEEDLDCEQIHGDWEREPIGDFLGDNQDVYGTTEKKKGRSITLLKDIFERPPGMPKIKVAVNHLGQPVGDNYRHFCSAVGCYVRKKLSVGCRDWRKIDIKEKMAVWANIKETFDISGEAVPWFLRDAAKKWKSYISDLKKQYLNAKLTKQEIRKIHGERVNDDD